MIEFPTTVTRICVAGDWHSNTRYAQKALSHAQKEGAEVILHVGDFGYNFTDGYLNSLQNSAEQQNIIIMFVDGNHENFDWLYAQPVDEDGVRRLRERVWHLPRNFRWEWLGRSFLALGGAHSVDRQWRGTGEWWPQEYLTLQDFEKAMRGGHADVMITHDCPDKVDLNLPSGMFPDEDIEQAETHRYILGQIVDSVKPKWLFHGHYHKRVNNVRVLPNDNFTAIRGLDCDGKPFDHNMIVFNVEEL